MTALAIDSIAGAWEFLTAFGAGAGATVLLRWFWWRVTAEAEIAAMAASTVLASGAYLLAPELPYLAKLSLVAFGSALVWLPTAWRTAPEPAHLVPFYERVRPVGPGWRRVARLAGGEPTPLAPELLRWLLGLTVVLGVLIATGTLLLG